MPVVDSTTLPSSTVPRPYERELKIIMSPQTHAEVKGFTYLTATLAPQGGCTPDHAHEESGELMIVLSGSGKAWLGIEEFDLHPGISFYAPPGISHRTLNPGSDPLVIACIFVPSVNTDYIRANIEAARKAGMEKQP